MSPLVEKENQGEGLPKQIRGIYDGFLCCTACNFLYFFLLMK